jgi:hypothetical protein
LRKLFLDDVRKPYDSSWDVVRSYEQFVEYIKNLGVPDIISFDHDLADEHYPIGIQNPKEKILYNLYKEKTGYHAALYLTKIGKFPKLAIVHSFNPVGARNIVRLFIEAGINVIQRPYEPGSIQLIVGEPIDNCSKS